MGFRHFSSCLLCCFYYENLFSKSLCCSNISDLNKSTEAQETFPKLQIINKAQVTITAVYLEGYEFLDLSIKQNQSSVFELKDGMPGGGE